MRIKNIIIVGGCGQLGSNFAKYLSDLGHNVIISDSNKFDGDRLVKKIEKNIKFIKCDVTKDKEIDSLIRSTKKILKSIDAVIYCAYPRSRGWGTNFRFLKRKYLNQDLNNHLGSSIIFSQKILNYFIKQKYGNLIHFSSIQGLGAPKFKHYVNTEINSPIEYSAMKAGIINMTKYLAKLYIKDNVRVNCISPGGIFNNQNKIFINNYKKSCGSKGMLNAEDLNGTISYLLSDESRYLTGQNIIIDDGWSL